MLTMEYLHRRAARVLPEVVQTSGILLEPEGPNELAALLFPLRRPAAGMLWFRLSRATMTALESEPTALLQHACRARQGLGRRMPPFEYRRWRQADIPAGWVDALAGRLKSRAGRLRVYFTTRLDGRAWLAILPELRLALYLWRD